MTITDLYKFTNQRQQQEEQEEVESEELKKLKVRLGYKPKPFWHWVDTVHEMRYKHSKGNCCFVHILGAPQKDGHDMPLLPYQNLLYRMLQEHKRVWIKKSRGLGVTTYFLYWIAYCCLTKWKPGDRVCIVVGPRINLATDWIARFRNLFKRNFPGIYSELIKQQSTVTTLNGVILEGFPSHHVDTMRGLDNVKFIMSDESDYYPPFQQKDVRAVCEGYIGKPNSDPTIVFVSTPKAPGGLMQQIEQEQNSLYYKMFLDYHYGLEGPNPIYDKEQIEKAKQSPDFGREYEGKYLGLIGNIFSTESIENCQKIEYNPNQIVPNAKVSVGVDPSFGSSKFGIVATRWVNERIEIVIAEEHHRPDFSAMIDRIWEINNQMHISAIYCDAANPEIWKELKKQFNEQYSESYVFERLAQCKKNNTDPNTFMRVIPVPFSTQGAEMLQHAKSLVEDPDRLVAIHPMFQDLLTALRTAEANDYKLNKEVTSFNDILDAFRLSLIYYKRSG